MRKWLIPFAETSKLQALLDSCTPAKRNNQRDDGNNQPSGPERFADRADRVFEA